MTELRNVESDLALFRTRVLVIGLAVLVAFRSEEHTSELQSQR